MSARSVTHPWRLYDLLQAAGVGSRAASPGFDPVIKGLAVDSRAVVPGTCFVALPGACVDGHDYVERALAAGAVAVVVEAGRIQGDCPRGVHVSNTHEALAKMAAAYYGVDRLQRDGRLKLVGVTGTNGKTTVCQVLQTILRAAGHTTACLGTIHNDLVATTKASSMTTLPPLELCAALARSVEAGATHAVLEVSSHALDQRRTAGLVFEAAVFTNLTQDHLDYHETTDAYARAKKRLFDGLGASATAVVCADDPRADDMVADTAAAVVRYGLAAGGAGMAGVDVSAASLSMGAGGSAFDLCTSGSSVAITSALIGEHNVRNMLGAAGASRALGVSLADIQRGLSVVGCVRGRLERVGTRTRTRAGAVAVASFDVFVDYAHTPDALSHVLAVLRGMTRGRLICVFGCGGDRDRGKRPLMGAVVAGAADVAIVTSDNPRMENPDTIVLETLMGMDDARAEVIGEVDRREAIELAVRQAGEGDVVLIAGKGHEDYQIIGNETFPFDDREVVQDALRRLREVA